MSTLLRRRTLMLAESTPAYPQIDIAYGGTPWSDMVAIAEPNILYVASQNWNAAYYSLRDRTRTDPVKTFSTEWFRIPANAECQLVLRNVQRNPDHSTYALNIGLYVIDDVGETVGFVRSNTIPTTTKDPQTFTANFVTNEEKIIHNMYVRGWSTSKWFSTECELWVNGVQWL